VDDIKLNGPGDTSHVSTAVGITEELLNLAFEDLCKRWIRPDQVGWVIDPKTRTISIQLANGSVMGITANVEKWWRNHNAD